MITRKAAYLILLLEGLASSGLQLTAIRQVIPYAGSSVITTSIVVSVFLAALALGYFVGGKSTAENFSGKLSKNLILSVFVFGMGLSFPFVAGFFETLRIFTGDLFLLGNPFFHLFVYSLLVIAPLVFLLAQTVPLLLHTAKGMNNSESAGNYTALSTIGNVIGGLLTTLVLMQWVGVGKSILFNCALLLACWVIVNFKQESRSGLKLGAGVLASFATLPFMNINMVNQFLNADSVYANIFVAQVDGGRVMSINNSMSSFIADKDRAGFKYADLVQSAIKGNFNQKEINPSTAKILILGAGGFSITAKGDMPGQYTYVDIDSELLDVAEKLFLQAKLKDKFIEGDARQFVIDTDPIWDVIVLDTFSDRTKIPAHLATEEFFKSVASKMAPNGITIMNIIASPYLTDDYSRNMDSTIRSAFDYCSTSTVGLTSTTNMIYLCNKSSAGAKTIYTDDLSRIEIEGIKAARN